MKKLLTLVTTLLLGSLSFAQNHNALRFRQPLAFHQYLIRDLHQQTLERDRSLFEALHKKKQTLQYIADARQRMMSIVGELPERGELKAQVTGSVQGYGFHVEKIVFQSAPGRYVTAHLYLPDNISRRIPACIEMCGHGLNGKGNGSMLACRMAVNGIAVMVVDPLSQGERLQLHDAQGKPLSISTIAGPSTICSPAATSTLTASEPMASLAVERNAPIWPPSTSAFSVPVSHCSSPRGSVPWN